MSSFRAHNLEGSEEQEDRHKRWCSTETVRKYFCGWREEPHSAYIYYTEHVHDHDRCSEDKTKNFAHVSHLMHTRHPLPLTPFSFTAPRPPPHPRHLLRSIKSYMVGLCLTSSGSSNNNSAGYDSFGPPPSRDDDNGEVLCSSHDQHGGAHDNERGAGGGGGGAGGQLSGATAGLLVWATAASVAAVVLATGRGEKDLTTIFEINTAENLDKYFSPKTHDSSTAPSPDCYVVNFHNHKDVTDRPPDHNHVVPHHTTLFHAYHTIPCRTIPYNTVNTMPRRHERFRGGRPR